MCALWLIEMISENPAGRMQIKFCFYVSEKSYSRGPLVFEIEFDPSSKSFSDPHLMHANRFEICFSVPFLLRRYMRISMKLFLSIMVIL